MKKNKTISIIKSVLKRPKNPNFEIVSTLPLIFHIIRFYFFKLVDFIFDFIDWISSSILNVRYASKHKKAIARIHFLLGLDAIKKNKLLDARMRFWLASLFMKHSETLFYHIAFLQYLLGNIEECIKWLSKIQGSKKNTKRVKEMIVRLKKTNFDVINKLNIQL